MNKTAIIALLTFLVFGCASTKTPHMEWYEKLEDFNTFRESDPTPEADYLRKFEIEARFLNTIVESYTNEDGILFYAFQPIALTINLPSSYGRVATPQANQRFANSCPGSITNILDLGLLYKEGLVSFDEYATEEQLKLLEAKNGKKLFYFHKFSGERWRSIGQGFSDYYGLKSIGKTFFYGSELQHDNYFSMTVQKNEGLLCIVDRKIHSMAAYSMAARKVQGEDGSLKPVREFTPVYVPEGSISAVLSAIFEEGFATQERVREEKRKQKERKQRRNAAKAIRYDQLRNHNSEQRATWNNRLTAKYVSGDKVCTEDNFFGYVEESNSNNTKVLVKGRASDQPDMFFFGNSNTLLEDTFITLSVEQVKWFKNSAIAKCSFK
ncbi:hypothetical protein HGG63_07550 [Alteromonadaceae bacterium A_SAG1]|nr:hypothetical protein [Alteromonadaceae bacterium A_SAG1]